MTNKTKRQAAAIKLFEAKTTAETAATMAINAKTAKNAKAAAKTAAFAEVEARAQHAILETLLQKEFEALNDNDEKAAEDLSEAQAKAREFLTEAIKAATRAHEAMTRAIYNEAKNA